jgi:hypothetical protein
MLVKVDRLLLQASVSEPTVNPFGDCLPSGFKHHVVSHVGKDVSRGAISACGIAYRRQLPARIIYCTRQTDDRR